MATAAPASGWILEANQRLRLFTLFILYVGQGLPIGLFMFAIPAWMAVNGASPAEVGSVTGLTALPWSLKFFNGFLMDRYTYLPMGRRRAWILAAQSLMVLSLLAAAVLAPAATDVALLGAIGFTLHTATAFQDVAVDGLAVDIMTEDERARGSGLMFGGQALGVAAATAGCGVVIDAFGAQAAFLLAAAIITALCVYTLVFRERTGERRHPWSEGEANKRNLDIQIGAWWPLLRESFKSIVGGKSLFWILTMLCGGVLYGGMTGAVPLIGANYVGWDLSTISTHIAASGLVAGLLAMTLGGWLGDRYGAKRIGIGWILATIALMAIMYFSVSSWGRPPLFLLLVYGWLALHVLRAVALLPISMRLCSPGVAATQFTIYMAVGNFGIPIGAFALSLADDLGGLKSIFAVVAVSLSIMLLLLVTVKFPRRPEYYEIQKRREIMAAHKPA
ncbi:MFS transporter [Qipengyuania sphaerica]|uniref:MFS transporter n=1 Tax=Qipengyuania sphaerica TaxID=2867243 RepID=UPI001C8A6FB7|nr:MFS transporter [Qipengyuania sphaerica]MBX7541815.1 MFS transporter [Qipengyuania sphaerica]